MSFAVEVFFALGLLFKSNSMLEAWPSGGEACWAVEHLHLATGPPLPPTPATTSLVFACDGTVIPFVARPPVGGSPGEPDRRVLCIPILSRPGGFLLALPRDSVPPSLLSQGNVGEPDSMFGPSTTLSVPAMEEEEDGGEVPSSGSLEVLVVDFADSALEYIEPFDPFGVTDPVPFSEASPNAFPQGGQLVSLSQAWVRTIMVDRTAFYSAQEADQPEADGVTQALSEKHQVLEDGSQVRQRSRWGAASLAGSLGPPPKAAAAPAAPALQAPLPPDALEGVERPEDDPALVLHWRFKQRLSQLVTHLIQASEASGDFGAGPSSSGLSSRASAKREKLQSELAQRTGNFMLAVAQNGFKRMYPSEAVPHSLEEFGREPRRFTFAQYLERHGGYQHHKDLGLIMFMVSQVADTLISGSREGALDLLSLLMVCLEQASLDNGKFEVAYTLSLFAEPPNQVFTSRGHAQNSRLRAFAPLCPPTWATTALAFLKETDTILARRNEAAGGASSSGLVSLPCHFRTEPSLSPGPLGGEEDRPKRAAFVPPPPPAQPPRSLSGGLPMDQQDAFDALHPYRALDPDRLKLAGRANWDPTEYLDDLFYLPFREPQSILLPDVGPPASFEVPDISREVPSRVLGLAKLWDRFGLLRLSADGPASADQAVRIFNAAKNRDTDRQIGDRRGRNRHEGVIQGGSAALPCGPALCGLLLDPSPKASGLKKADLAGLAALDVHRCLGGDALGVEFACSCHSNLLSAYGGDQNLIEGLIIDDWFAVACQPLSESGPSASAEAFAVAQKAYSDTGLFGSDKDLVDEPVGCIAGAELDSSASPRELGLALVGPGKEKRIALAAVTLEAARLPVTSDSLHLSIVGAWVSGFPFRRPLMSIFDRVFRLVKTSTVDERRPARVVLPRRTADELVLAASLFALLTSDVAAPWSETLFATDSSEQKEAIVEAKVPAELTAVLWRSAPKASDAGRLLTKEEAVLHRIDPDREEGLEHGTQPLLRRAPGCRFHFLEFWGSAGSLGELVAAFGWTVGPRIDPALSSECDPSSLRVFEWAAFLVERGRVDAVALSLPLATFSWHQRPSLRSKASPLGSPGRCSKTAQANRCALRALALLKVCLLHGIPALLFHPAASFASALPPWQSLCKSPGARVGTLPLGAVQPGWSVLTVCLPSLAEASRGWRLEAFLPPPSGLASRQRALQEAASLVDLGLSRRSAALAASTLDSKGLESPFVNNLAISASWTVTKAWVWPRPVHINILEASCVYRLLGTLAKRGQESLSRPLSCPPPVGCDITLPEGLPFPSLVLTFSSTLMAHLRNPADHQRNRDALWEVFLQWLDSAGIARELFTTSEGLRDIDSVNCVLARYGRDLYSGGRPYAHYSETLNALSARAPKVRRLLQPAWDLAFSWKREEPGRHHAALPWQVLLSLVAAAFTWGWPRVAAALALAWGGLLRIGEVLQAVRADLTLPHDVRGTVDYAYLTIRDPKTRYHGARHQAVRIDQPDLLAVVSTVYKTMGGSEKLWPWSGQTLRVRFRQLCSALGPPYNQRGKFPGLELSSLRAGGATWLLMQNEDSELVRHRGRWLSHRILEIYIREVSSIQLFHT
ncbi:hypothetical protein AK812_SmicGene20848 [Symbiodinium microadriaticum]|uniref:Uncharacterized protein n=1 Tax=Symbiodinium microadriaticum TaxID=2951 RepID=A0A1Q9DP18_SYMMI|nr:hypothetical protein AK812_SmicGene20848 [Symbiodinium microadriaticum]